MRKPALGLSAAVLILITLSLSFYAVWHNAGKLDQQSGGANLAGGPAMTERQNPAGAWPGIASGGQQPGLDGQRSPNRWANRSGNFSGDLSLNGFIVAYSIGFFLLVIAAYYFFVRNPGKIKLNIHSDRRKLIILALFCAAFLLRIVLGSLILGYSPDLMLFKTWAVRAADNLSRFYLADGTSDYPPLYIYVLYVIGKVGSFSALSPYFTILLKLPSILADLGTAFLLLRLARKYISDKLSLFVAAFYLFNPAVFVNSALWGQVDSFFTLLVTAGMVLLTERKVTWASVLFTAAVLMKPQGIIFLPVLFFELVKEKSLKSVAKVLAAGLATALALVLPFSADGNGFWIIKLFANTIGEYPYASVNAFNFFYLLGANFVKDTSTFILWSYHVWGMIFIVLVTLTAWLFFARGKNRNFVAAAALILISGVFVFSVGMHERYLFPAVALAVLALIYLKDKRLILVAAGFSVTSFVNTYDVLGQAQRSSGRVSTGVAGLLISILNLIVFAYLIKIVGDLTLRNALLARGTGSK